jgi:hypothetical protein
MITETLTSPAAAKECPILFSAPMVRAILDGSKTQTRRSLRVQPPAGALSVERYHHPDPRDHFYAIDGQGIMAGFSVPCPYGQPADHHWYPEADRLWVREAFCPIYPQDLSYNGGQPIEHDYAATYKHGNRLGDHIGVKKTWKPSIHMPRCASRINLEITGVRVERLQSISERDSLAEGVTIEPHHSWGYCAGEFLPPAMRAYRDLWKSINAPGSWEANPWVWVIEFRRVA